MKKYQSNINMKKKISVKRHERGERLVLTYISMAKCERKNILSIVLRWANSSGII